MRDRLSPPPPSTPTRPTCGCPATARRCHRDGQRTQHRPDPTILGAFLVVVFLRTIKRNYQARKRAFSLGFRAFHACSHEESCLVRKYDKFHRTRARNGCFTGGFVYGRRVLHLWTKHPHTHTHTRTRTHPPTHTHTHAHTRTCRLSSTSSYLLCACVLEHAKRVEEVAGGSRTEVGRGHERGQQVTPVVRAMRNES